MAKKAPVKRVKKPTLNKYRQQPVERDPEPVEVVERQHPWLRTGMEASCSHRALFYTINTPTIVLGVKPFSKKDFLVDVETSEGIKSLDSNYFSKINADVQDDY